MRFLILLFVLTSSLNHASALEKVNESLYKYAKACPETSARNIRSLVSYLMKGGSTQTQDTELFCYWISENIQYDTQGFLTGKFSETKDILTTKKGVCENYAELLFQMCELAEIECHVIVGYAKGYGYNKTKALQRPDHAWNVVKLDGKYLYVDATWSSGYVELIKGKLTFFKKLDVAEIFANPDHFLSTHLPGDPRWQLRNNPITIKSFMSKDSIAEMLKLTIPNYSFQDSLNTYLKADSLDRSIITALSTYNFNPVSGNLSSLADGYYNKAWTLSNKNTVSNYDLAITFYNLSIVSYTGLKSTYGNTWIKNAKEGIVYCKYKKIELVKPH